MLDCVFADEKVRSALGAPVQLKVIDGVPVAVPTEPSAGTEPGTNAAAENPMMPIIASRPLLSSAFCWMRNFWSVSSGR